jgi:hypothetical protein
MDQANRLSIAIARAAALFCAAALLGISGCWDSDQGAADYPADVVFENGTVYTVDPTLEWARAVAVKDKRIVYVGDDAGVAAYKGPNTRVVDLADGCCYPASSRVIHTRCSAPWRRAASICNSTPERQPSRRCGNTPTVNPIGG